MKKAALHNLGCKVNAYETEAMQQRLEERGYEIVEFTEAADVYIINTCTVTNIADRKSRQMIHRARRLNPDAVVVAAGCYVQTSMESGEIDADIDIVVGNNKKYDIAALIEAYEDSRTRTEAMIDIAAEKEYEDMPISKVENHTRAYIKIQDGCNQFCTYCIIPYARGRVRSRQAESVLKEVIRLADGGYQEIVLTGIHLSSYGVDFETEDVTLLSLIKILHDVDGIERIRLGSLEPRIMTEEFVGEIAKLHKVCPHFHLSLQSGCDTVLKRMNRKYTTEEYYETCKRIRRYYVRPAITTDVIVGFPGETEEEFEVTKDFLKKVGFFEMHIFKYSKRNGTKAAVMPEQIPEKEKTRRSNMLLQLSERMSAVYRSDFLEEIHGILIEETIEFEGESYQVGHTKEYVKMAVKGSTAFVGQIIPVCAGGVLREDVIAARRIEGSFSVQNT